MASCYAKGHIHVCPMCKNKYSGALDKCPHCNPSTTDEFRRPTMTIQKPKTPMSGSSRLTVTAKMVYADGPDRTITVDEIKEAQSTESSASEQESAGESGVVHEQEEVPVTDDESTHEDHDDAESPDDESDVMASAEETPAENSPFEGVPNEEAPIEEASVEAPVEDAPVVVVPAEDSPAPKTLEEKLSQLAPLEIPDREAEVEQELSGNEAEVEVIRDTPEDLFSETAKMMQALSQPRQEVEKVAEKPERASTSPVKNGVTRGKSVKHLAAQLNQTSENSSCSRGRCSVHGKRTAQASDKKAEFVRPALTKTKTNHAPHQMRGPGDKSNEELGECF
ncbi:uncharacterized protein KD926_001207 [Aspergillus affinis]|uniref:uncharacterized protein n=1 Tax=Aspergillus affinis TaxID=1070780 RepID=UPI0022FF096E|nr:uncharacterized protein KD926_001207 [Aspergillus affinis]KAI9036892.1 hypothetical protein KD926_001207 [Aspergillus affinis]